MQNCNPAVAVVGEVDNAVVAATSRVQTRKVVTQRLTQSVRVRYQGAEDEFDARGGHFLG